MTKKTPSPDLKNLTSQTKALENGNLQIDITIPATVISDYYQKTLAKFQKTTEIKGFRKGKAPAEMVEKTVGQEKIRQEMAKDLLTHAYIEALNRHKISPVVDPKIRVTHAQENQDWQIECLTCELPRVDAKGYREIIKKGVKPEIWTPKQESQDKKETKTQPSPQQKTQVAFSALLKEIPVKIPALLLEDEVSRMLSRLIDQTNQLGLSVSQYLKSVNKTEDQLKNEYQQQADNTLRLELILAAIADLEKVSASDEEVDQMIRSVPNEQARKNLEDPRQKAYIRQLLRKNKVIDSLSKI